jgi:hypothetical protein
MGPLRAYVEQNYGCIPGITVLVPYLYLYFGRCGFSWKYKTGTCNPVVPVLYSVCILEGLALSPRLNGGPRQWEGRPNNFNSFPARQSKLNKNFKN